MPATQFASTKQGGMCTAMAPDVCNTPTPTGPVPTPYPNMGQCMTAVKTATRVKFGQMPALLLKSEIPMSNGDEAGVNGGVVSGVIMNKVVYRQGSATVKVEGSPVVFHTSMTAHNGTSPNTMGQQTVPSQFFVKVGM